MATKVAVIGAGPLGLIAMKILKEDGFKVTGFEARPYVGGLWKYSEDAALSVAESTIFNTSRYRTAISDFRFPPGTADYPTWQEMHRYLESYCDAFDLRPHIQLCSPVTRLSRSGRQWVLHISPPDCEPRTECFDKVVVATGTFTTPRQPHLPGIENFKGSVIHAINFHRPALYKDKNVLLVGLHATAQDVAVALLGHANKLYVSHRNGVLLIPRYAADGSVFDRSQSLMVFRLQLFLSRWLPTTYNWLMDFFLSRLSAKVFPGIPPSWGFSPAPSFALHPPLVADEIYPLFKSGFAEPVTAIERVTGGRSLELRDGRVLTDVDAIIFCTGYDTSVPFVDNEYNPYPVVGESPHLYRGIFPLHADEEVRNSLAFLGHGAFNLVGFIQAELCTMAVSQIWLGHSALPSYEEMKQWHSGWMQWRQDQQKAQSTEVTFLPGFVSAEDQFPWLDRTAGTGLVEHFSWFSLRSWSFWWRDRRFYTLCNTGFFSPALVRLFDMGKRKAWSQAREQIYKDNEDVARGQQERLRKLKND
ncbi:uncharacterized protein PV09_04932 [Verruconis gallopava]|uniref:FAD/NAD(P)-binding domain-containing protein n=1 Tax=Verruconis gallopava TaxID=253628 RepID=A0A0D1YTY4_9PEZI|nr:uncharacterized protein PV09_04932 [Verruconis gallopava]KIW04122.1 hypothetical protein PV09_04932 [Verruconis gallopava]